MKKKIIEFTTAMVDGGAETLVKDYALFLNKEKYEVVIVTLYAVTGTANEKRVRESGIHLIPIFKNHSHFMRLFRTVFGKWYIPYRLRMILEKEKPDCIHAHLQVLRYLSKISERLNRISLLYTCHNLPKLMFRKDGAEYNAAKELIINHNLRLIALHEEMAKELNYMFGVNSIIIENGVDFNKFQNVDKSKDEIRRCLRIPENAYVIGHIGRFTASKNHMFLIDIFEEILRIKSNALLLMIGSGKMKNEILQKIKSKNLSKMVMILSHRTDIPDLLKAMDVFVFPSLYEGLPVTLVEAQAAGLRCVVSDSINKETVLSPQTVLVNLNESISTWCDNIIDTTIITKEYGTLENYDLMKTIKKLEKLYAE